MLFTITYDPELMGMSIAKKDRYTIPPAYEQVYRTGCVYKFVTDAYDVQEACRKFWSRYNFECKLNENEKER